MSQRSQARKLFNELQKILGNKTNRFWIIISVVEQYGKRTSLKKEKQTYWNVLLYCSISSHSGL
jgi:hypothetical protein